MAVERREKDGGGGGRGGKDRNLTLVDVYDIAADIGKVVIIGMVLMMLRLGFLSFWYNILHKAGIKPSDSYGLGRCE